MPRMTLEEFEKLRDESDAATSLCAAEMADWPETIAYQAELMKMFGRPRNSWGVDTNQDLYEAHKALRSRRKTLDSYKIHLKLAVQVEESRYRFYEFEVSEKSKGKRDNQMTLEELRKLRVEAYRARKTYNAESEEWPETIAYNIACREMLWRPDSMGPLVGQDNSAFCNAGDLLRIRLLKLDSYNRFIELQNELEEAESFYEDGE